jgi:hypothetical protein
LSEPDALWELPAELDLDPPDLEADLDLEREGDFDFDLDLDLDRDLDLDLDRDLDRDLDWDLDRDLERLELALLPAGDFEPDRERLPRDFELFLEPPLADLDRDPFEEGVFERERLSPASPAVSGNCSSSSSSLISSSSFGGSKLRSLYRCIFNSCLLRGRCLTTNLEFEACWPAFRRLLLNRTLKRRPQKHQLHESRRYKNAELFYLVSSSL